MRDKSKPTMNLDLKDSRFDPDTQKFLVVHEFGHALGLEHEHQRSGFWKVASKFVDTAKMKTDPSMQKVDFAKDWGVSESEVVPQSGQCSNYDPQSVMHYWWVDIIL